ncbi:hypothetical protein [Pseudomonas khavaziana]|uniref:hypothetical protein n=1 Tax=Pseudomonas khavaziana TaxID=2842351 RepID=UPI001C3C8C32|nr:hypothetical protein [Pseudomonas khavaziana]MBV4482842.1 hypothetical protein [Pseudomonas khavaziana]
MKDAKKVSQSLRELWPDLEIDDVTWSDQPQGMIGQLEDELLILEDHTSELADSFGVFYKIWNPEEEPDQPNKGLAERAALVKKRIAAMNDALAQMQAKLGGAGA